MILFEESCGVIMTADKKCIVRGRSRRKTLCLVGEKSRLRVYKAGISKGIESLVELKYLELSDGVKKKYNIDTNMYKDAHNIIGKLESVKIKGLYVLRDEE